jgi:plastocyanin
MYSTRNPRPRRPSRLLIATIAAGALFAVASTDALAGKPAIAAAANAANAVEIKNFQFLPPSLTVSVGTTVTWTNDDTSPHTVTEQNKVFRSAALDTGETYSHTFATPGEYVYRCTIHPMMVGKIIVKPAGKSS